MGFSFKGIKPQAVKKTWKETIIERIQDGKVLPIISNSFTNELALKSHQALIEGWADVLQYPLTDQPYDLPKIAQYASINKADEGQSSDELQIKKDYLTFLKDALFYIAEQDPHVSAGRRAELADQARELTVSQLAWHLNYPSLDSWQANPLLLLADLPLPIYLTTGYHQFLEAALLKAGKKPQSEFARWHPGLEEVPAVLGPDKDYEPTPAQPLVYHLHGLDDYPASLVLTEDDHLDFLTYISRHHQGAIHARVTSALTTCSLLMLGYSLRDWDFRVLFRGVIKPRPQSIRMTNVAIQLEDTPLEKEFVKKYLRQVNFEVEWNDPLTFIHELHQGYMR